MRCKAHGDGEPRSAEGRGQNFARFGQLADAEVNAAFEPDSARPMGQRQARVAEHEPIAKLVGRIERSVAERPKHVPLHASVKADVAAGLDASGEAVPEARRMALVKTLLSDRDVRQRA